MNRVLKSELEQGAGFRNLAFHGHDSRISMGWQSRHLTVSSDKFDLSDEETVFFAPMVERIIWDNFSIGII
jgi:hypothetical protein